MTALFDLNDVHYAYRDTPALTGLSLAVEAGRRVALLGANGSGKSTLLRVLDGLYFPDSGTVTAFGAPLTRQALADEATAFAFRRRVGYVFQNADIQLFNPTVFDELAFGPLQLGLPRAEIRHKVEEALVRFDLAALRDRAPHRLSGGEKKRVALASVLILEPDVLLMDEPTAALDPRSAGEIIALLAALQDSGRTVITATHDLDSLAAIADLAVVLQDGRVAAQGPVADILADHALLARTRLLKPHADLR